MSERACGSDPVWYRSAIIYQLHVRTFCDGNGDGIGDFAGLTSRLDYLHRLGVTCLWLMPFYASPLLDDGYDIADYRRVHPAYGTLDDVRAFVAGAHARGMRVITELVLNHTSDQHPWFDAARRAPAGSPSRDYYVWSDTDRRYAGARVIFRDKEPSNWTWDETAHAYYWHRFYRHQPDLNFDSADVRREIASVMRFWLDLGVDGFRLDAVPYLFEREGTACENLPETHEYLKALRAGLVAENRDCVLLAEVNQPPRDALAYFGAGDECQMAFNAALMAAMFVALERGDARPIVEAVTATSPVPDGCQWALFLRNHDELTLSPLGPEERELMLRAYAPDPAMRLNGHIRRRLAPLVDSERAAIELLNALLFSLPGAPVIYYADEIGAGDDVSRPDRDGLRLPMPWPAVVRQEQEPGSLLSWMKMLVAARRAHPALATGSIEFLKSARPAELAFVRRLGASDILVRADLAARTVVWEASGRQLLTTTGITKNTKVTKPS